MLSSNFKTSLYCRENILKRAVPSLAFLLNGMFIYTNSLLVRLFSTSGSLPIWGKRGNVSRGQFYQVCLTFLPLLALSGFASWKPRNANKRWNVLNTSLGWFATIKVFHSSPDRPLYWFADPVHWSCLCSCRAERSDCKAGARCQHHPVTVCNASPRCWGESLKKILLVDSKGSQQGTM